MAKNNVNDDLADFDPMRDAYGDYMFNNYGNGYGQPQVARTNPAVYVQGIPLDMEPLGLRFLFNKAGNVLSVDNFHQPRNCPFRVGKVVYESLQDVSRAIALFHLKEPYNLKVKIFRETQSLLGPSPFLPGNCQYGNPQHLSHPHQGHSIRGAMMGNRTSETRDDYRHPTHGIINGSCEFRRLPLRQPHVNVDQARLCSRESPNVSAGAAHTEVNQNRNRAAVINGFADSQGAQSRLPTTHDAADEAARVGTCLKCGSPPIYRCTRCNGFYCSHECQMTDWDRHKQYCMTRAMLNNVAAAVHPRHDGPGDGRQEINVGVPTATVTAAPAVQTLDCASRTREQTHSNVSHSDAAKPAAGNQEWKCDTSAAPKQPHRSRQQRPPLPQQSQQQQEHHNGHVKQDKCPSGVRPKTPTFRRRNEIGKGDGYKNRKPDSNPKLVSEDFAAKCAVSQATNSKSDYRNRNFDDRPPVQKTPTGQTSNRRNVEWPSAGSQAMVFARSRVDPWDFWVARTDRKEALELITKEIQREASACSPLKAFSVGDMVAAKFSEDLLFYRAVINHISTDGTFTVLYVDYGNSEETDRENLRPLSASLTIRPRNAFWCSIANVKPYDGDVIWSPSSIEAFRMCMNGTLIATCVDDSGTKMSVLVMDQEGNDIGELLCEAKRASPRSYTNRAISPVAVLPAPSPKPLPLLQAKLDMYTGHLAKWNVGEEFSLCFACTDGDSGLWMTVASFDDLQVLESLNLKCALNACSSHDASEGTIVSAFSLESNAWYRAIVRSRALNGCCTVQYLDYGNMETVDRVLPLPDEFALPPALAVQLTFKDAGTCRSVRDSISPEGLSVTVLEKGRVDEVKVRIALAMGIEEVLARSIWHTKFSPVAAPQPAQKAVNKFVAVPEAPIPRGEVSVRPVYVDSLDSVYVMTETFATLNQLQGELLAEYEKPSLKALTSLPLPDQPVCVQYSFDSKWYRGRVEPGKPTGDTVPIRYIDFGNAEGVPLERLKPLLPLFATLPQLALNVRPHGTASANKAALESILMGDQTPDWRMKVLDAAVRPVYVQLSKDGRTLEQMLGAKQVTADSPAPMPTPSPSKPKLPAVARFEAGTTMPLCFLDVLKGGIMTCFRAAEEVVIDTEKLCTEITERCQRDPPPPNAHFKPVVSDLALAKLEEDGRWYRCNVMKMLDGKHFEVMYSDYGNFARVSIDDMRPFLPEFGWLPLQCVFAKLEGVKCDRESMVASLKELVIDKHFPVEIVNQTSDNVYGIRIPELESKLKEYSLM